MHANHKIRFYEQMRDQYIGRTDTFSRKEVEDAEGEADPVDDDVEK